ncbi:MAG: transposase family protein [Desertimonas sp.]
MRMCSLLVGLPDVIVVGVGEWPQWPQWPQWPRIVITVDVERPSCCGRRGHRHGVREVMLVDLPAFGRPVRLVWRKHRWRCPTCGRSWTEQARSPPGRTSHQDINRAAATLAVRHALAPCRSPWRSLQSDSMLRLRAVAPRSKRSSTNLLTSSHKAPGPGRSSKPVSRGFVGRGAAALLEQG